MCGVMMHHIHGEWDLHSHFLHFNWLGVQFYTSCAYSFSVFHVASSIMHLVQWLKQSQRHAGQNGQMHFSRQKQRTDNQAYTRLYTCMLKCTLAGKGASSTRVDEIHENIIRAKCSRLEILPRYWSFSTEKLLKPNWWRRGCVYSAAAAAAAVACTGGSVGFRFVLCVESICILWRVFEWNQMKSILWSENTQSLSIQTN